MSSTKLKTKLMMYHLLFIYAVALLSCGTKKTATSSIGTETIDQKSIVGDNKLKTGAEQLVKYLPLIKNKRVGILANPTTTIGSAHLVDSLQKLGVQIMKVFGPEHGFRGNASAGIKVSDELDEATGIKIVSLYGKKRKPSADDLADIDIMIFDIQDVGCRFYTYINVLRDVMESCAEQNKQLLILDRPNPNGYLIDGPILDMKLKSGIGQFPIPISHGMTVGEFAKMINGEGWLPNGAKCDISIISVSNYTHDMPYSVPVKPSPNLNTQQSILLYPAVCLFEGTIINLGRGTQYPFTVLGAPLLKGKYKFNFTPTGIKGMAETPLHKDNICYGLDLRNYNADEMRKTNRIPLKWMLDLYQNYPDKPKFFDRTQSNQIGNIDYLAGVAEFKTQIASGISEEEIRKTWEPGLSQYKVMRKKYLLYP